MEGSKYTPEEILQILNDEYHFQSVFDPEVFPGEELTFQTSIPDWRDICDLIASKPLAKFYHDKFNLPTPLEELEIILSAETTTLHGFCRYIADHTIKQNVPPVIMMGQPCMSAAIFKTLTGNLKNRGVNVQDIRPSSKFMELFDKNEVALLEEVSKLAPGALMFEYEDNRISKTGGLVLSFFLLTIVIVPLVWHFHWLLLVPLFVGIALLYIGKKYSPAKDVIGGYDTVRDLIIGMQARM